MADRQLPTPDELRKVLRYEPETGFLFWREREDGDFVGSFHGADVYAKSFNSNFAGKRALTALQSGSPHGRVLGVQVRAHRAIWAIVHGHWPKGFIDHINGDRSDNRIENLRDVDRTANNRNARRAKNNRSGITGVSWSRGKRKWSAMIWANSRPIALGRFDCIAHAIKARREAEVRLGYHENHGK